MLTWLREDGQSLIDRYSAMAGNLKAAKGHQADFEKHYVGAIVCVVKPRLTLCIVYIAVYKIGKTVLRQIR